MAFTFSVFNKPGGGCHFPLGGGGVGEGAVTAALPVALKEEVFSLLINLT